MADVYRRTLRISGPEVVGDSQMVNYLIKLEAHSPHCLQEWIRMSMRNHFLNEPNLINSIRGEAPGEAISHLQAIGLDRAGEGFLKTLRISPLLDSVDSQMIERLKILEDHSPHYLQVWIRASIRNQFLKEQKFLLSIQGEVNEG
tara:strand:+ start:496 stop:930 length:435 start_codon:yes stop_codon:yes gene_type:complete